MAGKGRGRLVHVLVHDLGEDAPPHPHTHTPPPPPPPPPPHHLPRASVLSLPASLPLAPLPQDFYEDIFLELAKYGEIEYLNVCDNLADHMVGNVYVKFRWVDAGRLAALCVLAELQHCGCWQNHPLWVLAALWVLR